MKNVIMFCGKGGVGKTTCDATTALHYAMTGNKTLILSTDPTPSLQHIFELDIPDGPFKKGTPTAVTDDLFLYEVGSHEVKTMWNDKFGSEAYEVFSSFVDIGYDEFIDFVASVLPGLRDEFMVDYIRELHESGEYGKIVWDTAPAGQTLGLLKMPSIIGEHLKPAARIYTSLKTTGKNRNTVQGVIKGWEALSAKDMKFIQTMVEFNLVTIAEALAVSQLDYIFNEFRSYNLNIDNVIINQVVTNPDSEFMKRKAAMQKEYIAEISRICAGKQRMLSMFPYEITGLERLREAVKVLFGDD
ncbi:MAG: ArsA family ATPase [Syntrophobacterales bacterium]|nr:MAG: ArsA family ATPase [Syntrophobacterales bacterium]